MLRPEWLGNTHLKTTHNQHNTTLPQEAKSRIALAGLAPCMFSLLSTPGPAVLQVAGCRLATNLALDRPLRAQLAGAGLVFWLTELFLQQPSMNSAGREVDKWAFNPAPAPHVGAQLPALILGLLYLASMEDTGRHTLATSPMVLSR